MSKLNCLVVGYSVVLLGLFAFFCYLMTVVNPDKLDVAANVSDLAPADRRIGDDNLEAFYANEALFPAYGLESGGYGYGLEKIPERFLTIHHTKLSDTAPFTKELNRPKISLSNEAVNTDTVIKKKTLSYAIPYSKSESNLSQSKLVKAMNPPVKGFRRSIKDNQIESDTVIYQDSSKVILRILNEMGNSRVEIKLNPRVMKPKLNNEEISALEDMNPDIYKKSSLSNEARHKYSVIDILPNNTVMFKELKTFHASKSRNDKYRNDMNNHDIDSIITKNEILNTTFKNVDNNEETKVLQGVKSATLKNLPKTFPAEFDTEMYGLQMLFDNETKPTSGLVNTSVIRYESLR